LEAHVENTNCNAILLMVSMTNNLGPFGEDGGSSVDVESKGK